MPAVITIDTPATALRHTT